MALLPIHVRLNIERFSQKPRLLHVGITFSSDCKRIRYDYHPFRSRGVPYVSDISDTEAIIDSATSLYGTVDVPWGVTSKTWAEIQHYELHHLSQRRYILSVYDCRHYVRDFTTWAVGRPSPIWRLHELYDDTPFVGTECIYEDDVHEEPSP